MKRMTLLISTGDGVVGYGAGDGVVDYRNVGNRAIDLY